MTPYTYPNSITAGPDGNLWFAESNLNRSGRVVGGVGRLNLGFATVTEFAGGSTPGFEAGTEPSQVTSAGGHVWFTMLGGLGGVAYVNGDGTVQEYGPPCGVAPDAPTRV